MFQKIAQTMVPLACEFSLASTGLGAVDPAKTNVTLEPGDGGTATPLVRDESAPCHAGANGWQFTANYSRIVLCGAACDAVKASASGSVQVTVGCQTRRADGGSGDDGGFEEGWPDGGAVCLGVGRPCQPMSGADCCFGLTCLPGGGGSTCQSQIN